MQQKSKRFPRRYVLRDDDLNLVCRGQIHDPLPLVSSAYDGLTDGRLFPHDGVLVALVVGLALKADDVTGVALTARWHWDGKGFWNDEAVDDR